MIPNPLKNQVKEYWNRNVHNWKIAKSKVGEQTFFEEVERYRFEKLSYLSKIIDFNGYSSKKLLDVGCGLGTDLSRFVRGGAEGVGIDISPEYCEMARQRIAGIDHVTKQGEDIFQESFF